MSVANKVTVRGIVVARREAGEGSARILFYTDALGLITALAKSAREERSKLRPHLQKGTTGTYTLVRGRDSWRVTGAVDTENSYFKTETLEAKRSLERVTSAIRQFVRGEGSDPYLFTALFSFFRSLPALPPEYISEAECAAVLRMLAALGYVRDDERVQPFLSVSYDLSALELIRPVKRELVSVINEGISASGL